MPGRSPSNTLAAHKARLAALNGKKIEFGWFGSNVYPNRMSVAKVAALQEVGYTVKLKNGAHFTVPARPFMRLAVTNAEKNINRLVASVSGKIIDGHWDVDRGLKEIGMYFVNEIVMSIKTGNWAPNSAITIHGTPPGKDGKQFIKGKGFGSPLRHSGLLWQSANYQVF